MTKTIGRNATIKIAHIRETYTLVYSYTLANYFRAHLVADVDWVWQELDRYSFARLVEHEGKDGVLYYKINVHGNLWYELWNPADKDVVAPEPTEEQEQAWNEMRDPAERDLNYYRQA